MGKEALVERELLELLAACNHVANKGDRGGSPLVKNVRSFSRILEKMESQEILTMAKRFYSRHYLDAMAGGAWLEHDDVELVFGDDEDSIRFRLCHYARTAKNLDDSKGSLRNTLEYHTLKLLHPMASKSAAENFDERIQDLGKKLGKGAAAAAGPAGSVNTLLTSMMGAVKPMLEQLTGPNAGEDSPLRTLLNNPNTANMMRQMTSSLPAEFQKTLEPMIASMVNGSFDPTEVITRALQQTTGPTSAGAAPLEITFPDRSAQALEQPEESVVFSTDGVAVPDLPPLPVDEGCVDGVCYPEDH